MASSVANLAIAARDVDLVAEFWCAVLGWQIYDRDVDIVSIGPRPDSVRGIDVLAVPEPKTTQNRLHLDLRADGCTTAEELQRLLDLGATRVDVGQGVDVSWTVLADPEGNEFCLLSRTMQQMRAQ